MVSIVAALLAMGALAMSSAVADPVKPAVETGAARLVASGFAALAGKRVGLITNQTGVVDEGGAQRHLADLLADAPNVTLAAILAPEHGFRGREEAGKTFGDSVDQRTGVRVFSLYGETRKPTPVMLAGLDVLVFDIQDIGARFYTYISTMGLAMQAAAEAGLPFVVLDRPNPLGGDYVAGFMLEAARKSFVGQYPIPIVHGLTVGELARMIVGEGWLAGLRDLDLRVISAEGWNRAMRWPQTGLDWVAPSPNIPTFESALVYPGIGIIGLTTLNEGRGTPTPFSLFGAPWIDKQRLARQLDGVGLPGAQFAPASYRPVSIPDVALEPAHEGRLVNGVEVIVLDVAAYLPLEVGIHALALARAEAKRRGQRFFKGLPMFHAIAGSKRLYQMLKAGRNGDAIIASWQRDVEAFRRRREKYLLY